MTVKNSNEFTVEITENILATANATTKIRFDRYS